MQYKEKRYSYRIYRVNSADDVLRSENCNVIEQVPEFSEPHVLINLPAHYDEPTVKRGDIGITTLDESGK